VLLKTGGPEMPTGTENEGPHRVVHSDSMLAASTQALGPMKPKEPTGNGDTVSGPHATET
jgi:hypothetical protein